MRGWIDVWGKRVEFGLEGRHSLIAVQFSASFLYCDIFNSSGSYVLREKRLPLPRHLPKLSLENQVPYTVGTAPVTRLLLVFSTLERANVSYADGIAGKNLPEHIWPVQCLENAHGSSNKNVIAKEYRQIIALWDKAREVIKNGPEDGKHYFEIGD